MKKKIDFVLKHKPWDIVEVDWDWFKDLAHELKKDRAVGGGVGQDT